MIRLCISVFRDLYLVLIWYAFRVTGDILFHYTLLTNRVHVSRFFLGDQSKFLDGRWLIAMTLPVHSVVVMGQKEPPRVSASHVQSKNNYFLKSVPKGISVGVHHCWPWWGWSKSSGVSEDQEFSDHAVLTSALQSDSSSESENEIWNHVLIRIHLSRSH